MADSIEAGMPLVTGDERIDQATKETATAKAVWEPAPGPADFKAVFDSYVSHQQAEAARILAVPDGALEVAGVTAVPQLRALAEPYLKHREAVQADFDAGLLTAQGKRQREAVLKEAYATEVTAKVIGPLERQLAASAQFYTDFAKTKPVTEENRRRALGVVDDLQRLSPKHGIPIAQTAIRDALKSGDIGTLRALMPHLKDARDREQDRASATEGPKRNELLANVGELNGLVTKIHTATQGFETIVGEARLRKIGEVQYQLQLLAQAAAETSGEFEKNFDFRVKRSDGASAMLSHFVRE